MLDLFLILDRACVGVLTSACWAYLRMNAGCAGKTEMPFERVPYLSALEVCSRWGAIRIHIYLILPYLY